MIFFMGTTVGSPLFLFGAPVEVIQGSIRMDEKGLDDVSDGIYIYPLYVYGEHEDRLKEVIFLSALLSISTHRIFSGPDQKELS